MNLFMCVYMYVLCIYYVCVYVCEYYMYVCIAVCMLVCLKTYKSVICWTCFPNIIPQRLDIPRIIEPATSLTVSVM